MALKVIMKNVYFDFSCIFRLFIHILAYFSTFQIFSTRSVYSPINREFYLAKGTEKFILGRYLLSGILLILLSLRPWGVAARPAILENRGAKSHFCDYFIIRARYLYLSYYKKEHAILYIFCCLCFFVRSIVS
jgi:hypothetical protein